MFDLAFLRAMFDILGLLFVLSIAAWVVILKKAGYSGAWVLVIFLPFLGAYTQSVAGFVVFLLAPVVLFFVFAFSDWPVLRQARGFRQPPGPSPAPPTGPPPVPPSARPGPPAPPQAPAAPQASPPPASTPSPPSPPVEPGGYWDRKLGSRRETPEE